MGFGWLLLGYLTAFVLYLTANQLGLASFALLLGCALMLVGVFKLEKYEKRFGLAKYFLFPLLAGGVYQAGKEILILCEVEIPFFTSALAGTIYGWIQFFLLMFLQVILLLSISAIAKSVGLLHISAKAIRNFIFLAIYGVLYILTSLTFDWIIPARPYLKIPMILSLLLLVGLNLFLFLSCMKNIAPANEDETPKRYRWEFLNKIGDTFEKNRREAAESGRAYAEEKLRKRKEEREKKRIVHNKKK
ncbi:MAG: hypothetical protein IJR88_01605 [Clostridia bacterium]|nr:hypothetical protein [Clostridia bacterium]